MNSRTRLRLILIAAATLGIAIETSALVRAFVTDDRFVLALIGLYPVLLLYWIHARKLRFGLNDLTVASLGFGAALVPLHYLLERAGYSIREYPLIVFYAEVMIGLGFVAAVNGRARLH